MGDKFEYYVTSLIESIPNVVYEGLLLLLCIGSVILLVWKGKRAFKYFVWLCLSEYVFLLYCSTLIFRSSRTARSISLLPFWSYAHIQAGDKQGLLPENIMNVLVFIPLGLLLGMACKKKIWWKILGIGLLISFSIEVLQFCFMKGHCELDDVIHNTIGCFLGYCLVVVGKKLVQIFIR